MIVERLQNLLASIFAEGLADRVVLEAIVFESWRATGDDVIEF